jgi:hypothetical protein
MRSDANDADEWANGCTCFGTMLSTMSPSADVQRELVSLFWHRQERVVRVLYEEASNLMCQTALDHAETMMQQVCDHMNPTVLEGFANTLSRKASGQSRGEDKDSPQTYAAMVRKFSAALRNGAAAEEMIPNLLQGACETNVHIDCRKACVDSLAELGLSMGRDLSGHHQLILDSIGPLVFDSKVSRQARIALAAFAPNLSPDIFTKFVDQVVLENLRVPLGQTPSESKAFAAELVAALIPACGSRLKDYVPVIMNVFFEDVRAGQYINWDEPDTYFDFLSVCLGNVLGLLQTCPRAMGGGITSEALNLCLNHSWGWSEESESYNWAPGLLGIGSNYPDDAPAYDDYEASAWDDDGYSNRDTSYKTTKPDYVHCAALKVLGEIIRSRPDLIDFMLDTTGIPTMLWLVKAEKFEETKTEFVNCLSLVANQVTRLEKGWGPLTNQLNTLVSSDTLATLLSFADSEKMDAAKSTTAQRVFTVLSQMGRTVGWETFQWQFYDQLVWPMKKVVSNDASQGAKVACLTFLSELLQSGETLTTGADAIHIEVADACAQTFGVARRSLEACGCIAQHLTTDEQKTYVREAVSTQFLRDDLNGDIKAEAIKAMAHVVVADSSGCDLKAIQTRLSHLLQNDTTRTAAVHAIGLMAGANLDISYILSGSLEKIEALTRQSDKGIRHETLQTLGKICASASEQLSASHTGAIMQMLADKVSRTELKDTQLVCQATRQLVLNLGAACATKSQDMMMSLVCDVLRVDSFQGAACDAALDYVASLVTSGCDAQSLIKTILTAHYAPASLKKNNSGLSRVASFSGNGASKNLAMAIGAVTREAGAAVGNATAVSMLQESSIVFALYSIGEVTVDGVGEVSGLQNFITSNFEHHDEAFLFAAAFALGCLMVGNPGKYIPYVQQQLEADAVNKVVMLTAVQEAISRCVSLGKQELLIPYIESTLLPVLLQVSGSNNDAAVRKAHGCLGKLLQMAPEQVMPAIEQAASSGEPAAKVAALSCLRYYVGNSERESDATIFPSAIALASAGLESEEPAKWKAGDPLWPQKAREAAIQAVKAMLARPKYFRNCDQTLIGEILKNICKECSFSKQVVEKIGREEVWTDLALVNRVAAFECLTEAFECLEDKLSPFISEISQAAVLAANDISWKKGQSLESRIQALETVKKIMIKQPALLSEIAGTQAKDGDKATLIYALSTGFKDLRMVASDTPEDVGAMVTFLHSLRSLFAALKEIEPAHDVFAAIEELLAARHAMWAKSKAETTRELVVHVDDYRNDDTEGADSEC